MSKLDGNERWKTKMLLTEHKVQYEQRNQLKVTGVPTKEELTMIRDFIMYPKMEQMLQRGIDQIKISSFILKDLSARTIEVILFYVTNDYYDLKRKLKDRNIQVIQDHTNDGILYYRYTCRGYEETFGITREALRAEIGMRCTLYLDQLSNELRINWDQKNNQQPLV